MNRSLLKAWPKFHRADILAGLSVTGLMMPEAVAYAQLAGLPARTGLVALLCGLVSYGLLGSSRFAITAATSSTALILASVLGVFGHLSSGEKTALTLLVVVMAGVWFLLLAAFRLGVIANFIAKPVLRGTTLGLAVLVTLSQVPTLVGLTPGAGHIWEKLGFTLSHWPEWNWPSLATGLVALAILFLWRSNKQPVTLWVLLLSIAAVRFLGLGEQGVRLVGDISLAGLMPDWGVWQRTNLVEVAQFGLALAMMAYAESASTIRGFALKRGDTTQENRDLLALGVANVFSGLAGGLAVGAGFSGTSANEKAGAHTKAAGWVAALAVALAVLLVLPQLALVPQAVLAAIVIHAVNHGLSWLPLRPYFAWSRDRLLIVVAVVAVVLLGVLNGLLLAVSCSIFLTLMRFSRPRIAVLGRYQGGRTFVNMARFPGAVQPRHVLVVRIDEPLFFANADPVLAQIRTLLERPSARAYRAVVISMEETPDLDGTSIEALGLFAQELKNHGMQLRLCRLHSAAHEVLLKARFPALPASQLSSLSVHEAVPHEDPEDQSPIHNHIS